MPGAGKKLKGTEHGEGYQLRHESVNSALGSAFVNFLQRWETILITQEEHYLKSLNSLDSRVLN